MSQSWNRSSRVFRDLINIYWCATPRPGLHTVHFFCEIHFNGNSFLQLHTSQTWEFELTECLEIYDDPHDINNCWLFDASVKGVEKVEPLAIPYWLPTTPPFSGCNQLTAPPSQIDTFQTTPPEPASNPTFMPIGNNLLKSDRVQPRTPQTFVLTINCGYACFWKLGLN